nr:hypothetical protein [Prevotella sp.]
MKRKKYILPLTEITNLKIDNQLLAGSPAKVQGGKIWDERTQSWIDAPEMGGDAGEGEDAGAKGWYGGVGAFDTWEDE